MISRRWISAAPKERLADMPEGSKVVYLKADEGLDYSEVMKVMDFVREAGCEEIALNSFPARDVTSDLCADDLAQLGAGRSCDIGGLQHDADVLNQRDQCGKGSQHHV